MGKGEKKQNMVIEGTVRWDRRSFSETRMAWDGEVEGRWDEIGCGGREQDGIE